MKTIFILLAVIFGLSSAVVAQTKPPAKADTTKSKLPPKVPIKIDTPNVKYPLNLQSGKFDKMDSADLLLTSDVPIEKYGTIDTADLKLTSCDFEKDANAMVLFDRAEMACG